MQLCFQNPYDQPTQSPTRKIRASGFHLVVQRQVIRKELGRIHRCGCQDFLKQHKTALGLPHLLNPNLSAIK